MTIEQTQQVIIPAAEALNDYLHQYSDYIGISANNIHRVYNPEAMKRNMTPGSPPIVMIFINDADPQDINETQCITKNINISVVIMAHVENSSTEVIDSIALSFEKIQNLLTCQPSINDGNNGYTFNDVTTESFCDTEFISNQIAFFHLTTRVECTTPVNFECANV